MADPFNAIWTEIRRHRGWYLLAFLLGGLPVGLATIWPTLTHETVPEWLVKHGWPELRTLIICWVAVASCVVAVITIQAARRRKTRTTGSNSEQYNYSSSTAVISSVQFAEAESEWEKLDERQRRLLGRIYVAGELTWAQIDEEYKRTRPIYVEPLLFDYLLERSTLLDCTNPTPLIALRNKSSYFNNPAWKIKSELRTAVGEIIARHHSTSDNIQSNERPNKKSSLRTSLVAGVLNVVRFKVHRLLAFWLQLALISFVFAVIASESVGGLLVFSVVVAFPLCLAISRLVNRNVFLGLFVGATVVGVLEGAFMYSITDWATRGGVIYGAFYGASLTSWFSSKQRHLDLFWVVICTLGVIGLLLTTYCWGHTMDCFRYVAGDMELGVRGAVIPIVLGLGLSPVINPVSRFMESGIDRILDLIK